MGIMSELYPPPSHPGGRSYEEDRIGNVKRWSVSHVCAFEFLMGSEEAVNRPSNRGKGEEKKGREISG